MKRVISLLQSVKLRQIITVFLIGLTFFVSTAFDRHGNAMSALAEPVTPEARSYQVDNTDQQAKAEKIQDRIQENAEKSAKILEEEGIKVTNRAAESDKDPNKGFFASVKEKLNLDEPIDPGTKKAAEQVKEAVTGDSN